MMEDKILETISIKETMEYILTKRKRIFIFSLCIMLLLGAGRVVWGIIQWDDQVEAYQTAEEVYNNAYLIYQNDMEYYSAKLTQLRAEQEFLDCANTDIWRASATLVFETDQSEAGLNSLVKVYSDSIMNLTDWNKLADMVGVDKEFIPPLVSMIPDYSSGTIEVSIDYINQEGAEALLGEILQEVLERQSTIIFQAEYSVGIYNRYVKTVEDSLFISKYNEVTNEIAVVEAAVEGWGSGPDLPGDGPTIQHIVIRTIEFMIIGFIGSIFVISCIYGIFMSWGLVLHTQRILGIVSGLPVLGFYTEYIKQLKLSNCDRKLLSMEKVLINDSVDASIERIMINIGMHRGEASTVLLTGCVNIEKMNTLQKKLKNQDSNMEFLVGADVRTDNSALMNLAKSDVVVVVVKRDSRYSELQGLMQFLESEKKTIIGMVMI